jgi:hypothetical protein
MVERLVSGKALFHGAHKMAFRAMSLEGNYQPFGETYCLQIQNVEHFAPPTRQYPPNRLRVSKPGQPLNEALQTTFGRN